MRAAAIAAAVVTAFLGVMYIRFASDAVPPAEPASTPAFGSAGVIARSAGDSALAEACRRYTRLPKPAQCSYEPGWFLPTIPATPVPSVRLDSLDGVKVTPLEIGTELELPGDLALIIQPSCGNCQGPAGGLSRVYRDPAGQIRTDTLLTIESLGLIPFSPSDKSGSFFSGFSADDDASPLYVGVCRQGACFKVPESAGGEALILKSANGGVSWEELPGLDRPSFVSGVLPGDRLIVGTFSDSPVPSRYRILPADEELTPPAETQYPSTPLALSNGEIVWSTQDHGFLRSDGSRWLGPWADPTRLQLNWKFAFTPSLDRAVASAFVPSGDAGSAIVVVFRADGTLERAYSAPGYISIFAWLDDGRVLATADTCASLSPRQQYYSRCPGPQLALFDLEARTIHPLRPLSADGFAPYVVAVERGPFARVVNTEGTCLNVREAPNLGSPGLECAVDDVLLRSDGSTGGDGTNVFLHVVTPSGVEGWANAQYLER